MNIAIIIPARYGSTRFPGKPLAMVAGVSLLERVWRLARAVTPDVWIATDDARIEKAARCFHGQVLQTPTTCANGSARVAAALEQMPEVEAVLNLQGDAVLTPPWVLSAMLDTLNTSDTPIVTPAVALDDDGWQQLAGSKHTTPASGTLVVCDRQGNALYFSKAMIPFSRTTNPEKPAPRWRHIGLYGYHRAALQAWQALPPSPLEEAEGLEQLRALEHGLRIRVVPVDYRGRSHASIDSPEDIPRVEAIIAREGELLP
jgi:3-deoxy-manno-octulosonate cytidylyltransferase (CMP-KDO synthetase)